MPALNLEGLPDKAVQTLAAMVVGAQKIDVVAGAGASTNIAVTGLANEDTVTAAIFVKIEAGTVKDVSKLTLVATTSGNIKTATDTTGGKIIVFWQDKSNG